MKTRDTVIATQGLTKRYGQRTAVNDLSLEVRGGEIYGFLGANGAGKTTTMRMMLGLIAPTSGTATVMGHRPGSRESLAEVGSMIETPAFYGHLSGRDNLRYLAQLSGTDVRRVDATLHQVGLLARADDTFNAYSLGMKQRLGVALALLKDPALLILDEPTNGLDPGGMAEMRQLIRQLGAEGRSVVISSHLMTEIEQVADRVGIIAGGALIREATVDELRGEDSLVISADPVEDAAVLIGAMSGVRHVERQGHGLRVWLVAGESPRPGTINARLVREGIEVRELRTDRPSLETVFLKLTNHLASEAA